MTVGRLLTPLGLRSSSVKWGQSEDVGMKGERLT